MGLLLGSSIVTVCEILDFILVTCLSKTVAWLKSGGEVPAKSKYYSDHQGYENSNNLLKAPSMHSLSNGVSTGAKDENPSSAPLPNFGTPLVKAFNPENYNKSQGADYTFERSVFSVQDESFGY